MSLKAPLLLLAAVLAALPSLSRANLNDAVNWARLQGCPAPVRGLLRDSPRLRQAVARVANGAAIKAALSSAGYVAARSSAVHVSGAASDAEVGSMLAAHYCGVITQPQLTEIGAQRRGRDAWILLATPVSLPASSDALVIRLQILDLVNKARLSGRRCGNTLFKPAAALSLNTMLSSAAYAHSREMATYGVFDHRGHDGSTPVTRVEQAGYGRYLIVGENIAAGAMTAAEVTQGWLDSPAHCENIMDPRFSEIGIGFAVNPSSSELVYWTQEFAAPGRAHIAAGRASP
jgi:uncharacterized protein YkwD